MTQWIYPSNSNIPPEILDFTGSPILAQLLAQRGLTTVAQARAFLDPTFYQPAPPDDLPDMDTAVTRLNQAISRQELVCVWGDFDVDGQTSTTLLVSMLQDLGGRVCYYIPNRLTESHGIKIPALKKQLARGIDILLTCDTGIAEHAALAAAQAAGVDVIVTDHHDLDDTLPPAIALINPKRLPPNHPLGELPGVGVAYKLAQALYQSRGRGGDEESLLDLVSMGIVADIARQTGDTRYLLQKGLAKLQSSARVGVQALLESANIKTRPLTEDHISFWLAPRLNALGRLGDANLAVELLTTHDLTRARIIVLQLEAMNDQRKLLVDKVVVQALGQIEDTPSLADYNAIVLAAAGWHPGVIGIAASRLVQQYGKPVILIALRPDGMGRGSARSVRGCDIHQAIKSQANLLVSFGGHPMAAGLAVLPENVSSLRRGVSTALSACRTADEKVIEIDLIVDLAQVSMELLVTIQQLAPFGAGNLSVKLGCTGLKIANETLFGKVRNHRRLTIKDDSDSQQNVIWWRGAAEAAPQGQFDLAFSLGPDNFKGGDAVQLEWLAAREWQPTPVIGAPALIDWRQEQSWATVVHRAAVDKYQLSMDNSVVWSEGVLKFDASPPSLPGPLPRHKLYPADNLVVLTTPASFDIFQQGVKNVSPQQIFLVAHPSSLDEFTAFVGHLIGAVKFAVAKKAGEVILEELAAALGHQVATARLGVDWLVANGKLSVYADEGDVLVLRPNYGDLDRKACAAIEKSLTSVLNETAAFRKFFRRAGLATLEKML